MLPTNLNLLLSSTFLLVSISASRPFYTPPTSCSAFSDLSKGIWSFFFLLLHNFTSVSLFPFRLQFTFTTYRPFYLLGSTTTFSLSPKNVDVKSCGRFSCPFWYVLSLPPESRPKPLTWQTTEIEPEQPVYCTTWDMSDKEQSKPVQFATLSRSEP